MSKLRLCLSNVVQLMGTSVLLIFLNLYLIALIIFYNFDRQPMKSHLVIPCILMGHQR
jgi:hypothetical protein